MRWEEPIGRIVFLWFVSIYKDFFNKKFNNTNHVNAANATGFFVCVCDNRKSYAIFNTIIFLMNIGKFPFKQSVEVF